MLRFTQFSAFIWLALGLWGCATYQHQVQPGLAQAKSGQWDAAVDHFKNLTQDTEHKDRLAYLLELGTVLQMAGRYQESANVFIEADRLADQLDYISLTQTTLATLGGEEMVQYKGESYEKIMINAMNALNFIALGDLDAAHVEVRRIDEKVRKFQRDNREDYEFNPFGTYLSGLIFEAQKRWDDAFIAYERTFKISERNPYLSYDLARVAKLAKREDQLKKIGAPIRGLDKAPYFNPDCKKQACGEVVVIFLQGWGPKKAPRVDSPQYPTLISTYDPIRSVSVELSSGPGNPKKTQNIKLHSVKVYDVQAAAINTLVADQTALALRRLGAFVAKEVVAKKIGERDEGLGFLAWLVMHLSDRADLRQWASLPESIQLARYQVPAGNWQMQLRAVDAAGQPYLAEGTHEASPKQIQVRPGKMDFIIVRSLK